MTDEAEKLLNKKRKDLKFKSTIVNWGKSLECQMAIQVIEELIKERDGFAEQYNMAITRNSELSGANEVLKELKKYWENVSDILSGIIENNKYPIKEHFPRWVNVKDRLPKDLGKLYFVKYVEENGRYGGRENGYSMNPEKVLSWLEEYPEQKYPEQIKAQIRYEGGLNNLFKWPPSQSNTVGSGNVSDTTFDNGGDEECVFDAEKINERIKELEEKYPPNKDISDTVNEWKLPVEFTKWFMDNVKVVTTVKAVDGGKLFYIVGDECMGYYPLKEIFYIYMRNRHAIKLASEKLEGNRMTNF